MIKTHDYLYRHQAPGGSVLLCRIRIYEQSGQTPVVVVTELSHDFVNRLFKTAAYLAAEIIARHFPERFETDEAVRWIEHDERGEWELDRGFHEFALVEFVSYTPRIERRAGATYRHIGQPRWTRLQRESVEAMIGQALELP